MNNVSSPPKKLERVKCSCCGLEAPDPVVVNGKCVQTRRRAIAE